MRRRLPWRTIKQRDGLTIRYLLAPDRHGRMVLTNLHIDGDAVTAEDLRHLSIRELEAQAIPDLEPPSVPLSRPDRTGPDSHYRLVAEHYRYHSARSTKPGELMAQSCGVPTPTVHTWIREARRRGFLPPARRGKAG